MGAALLPGGWHVVHSAYCQKRPRLANHRGDVAHCQHQPGSSGGPTDQFLPFVTLRVAIRHGVYPLDADPAGRNSPCFQKAPVGELRLLCWSSASIHLHARRSLPTLCPGLEQFRVPAGSLYCLLHRVGTVLVVYLRAWVPAPPCCGRAALQAKQMGLYHRRRTGLRAGFCVDGADGGNTVLCG